MACRAVEIWTLSSLVGAFLDLTLAHLLLVGATVAFFASKLLSLFGLSLPCTCDGHFGHPACSQTALLLDFPADRVAAARRSLLSRFPFDSFLLDGAASSQRCRYADDGGGSYCSASSLSRPSRPSRSLSMPAPDPPSAQSKSVRLGHMPPSLRRRSTLPRLGDSLPGLGKSPSASAEWNSGGPWDFDDEEVEEGLAEESAAGEKKDSCSGIGCDEGERLAKMSRLERELKKERGVRVALHLELEQERSAAATAADEAMAVMLRLQKEKAEIEMEARQYQRMIEEKSAYDEEEMEILKEIIVRREREKHFLEKEVEMYKQMLDSQERVEQAVDNDHSFLQENLNTLNDSLDNPVLMLEQIYKSIGMKEVANGFIAELSPTLNSNGSSKLGHPIQKYVDDRKHIEFLNTGDECYQEFQEKNILTTQINQSSSNIQNSSCAEDSILYNAHALCAAEYHKDIADLTVRGEGERVALIEIGGPVNGLCRMESNDVDQRGSESSQLETESSIHDVHVINDGQVLEVEGTVKQTTIFPGGESPCANPDEIEVNIRRSCSEITNRSSLINSSPGRTYFDLRRSSLPSVESERYKLESEVELLRKRLENIRQGREKLNLSADHKEKETFQLQLLDEIACQLNEIKKVMKPTKSIRRSSLPTPSSKFKGHSEQFDI